MLVGRRISRISTTTRLERGAWQCSRMFVHKSNGLQFSGISILRYHCIPGTHIGGFLRSYLQRHTKTGKHSHDSSLRRVLPALLTRKCVFQLRQMVSMNETAAFHTGFGEPSTVRILADARKKEVKATQNLSIIVLFFILCWMPLYTINCIQAFCENCYVPDLVLNLCIILSHLNSAGNPLLYAYRLSDFRTALRCLLFGFSSSENLYGRTEGGTTEFSIPKARQMISININPRKYLFPKNSLFKFDKESHAETRLNMRRDEYSVDSNDRYLTLATNSTYECSRRSGDTDSNNYGYLNSDYLESNISLTGSHKKRIQTVIDNSSYILMANFDNVRNSTKRHRTESDRRTRQPLQRRHSAKT